MTDKLDGLTMDIEQTEKDKLKAVFPQCFVEGKLDIDKLLNMCGEYLTMILKNTSLSGKVKLRV